MNELLAPPDIEPAIVTVLAVDSGTDVDPADAGKGTTGVWVGTEYEDNPAGSIRVSSTGGARPIDRVVVVQDLLVECWHDDVEEAQRIARRAWSRLYAASGSTVRGVDLKRVLPTSLNNNPDANRLGMVRFQFRVSVHTRLVLLEST